MSRPNCLTWPAAIVRYVKLHLWLLAVVLPVTSSAQTLTLGNAVWIDADRSGTYSSGEAAAGVVVELWSAVTETKIPTGADGDPNTAADNATDLVTDSNGCYLFRNLAPGSYFVKIPPGEFAAGKPLYGLLSVPGSQSGDDDTGEDGIDEAAPFMSGVRSVKVILADNGAPTGETGKDAANALNLADDDNTDLTVDLGFTLPLAQNCPKHLLYICGTSKGANSIAFDHGYMAYLAYQGFTLTPAIVTGSGLADPGSGIPLGVGPDDFDGVIASPTAHGELPYDLGGVTSALAATTSPVLLMEGLSASILGIGTNYTVGWGSGDGWVENNLLPILPPGLPNGAIEMLNTAYTNRIIVYVNGTGSGGTVGVWDVDQPDVNDGVGYIVYRKGATLDDATTAPAARVFYGITENAATDLGYAQIDIFDPAGFVTPEGRALLDQALIEAFPDCLALGNAVWVDADSNGQYDSGEGAAGVVVELWDALTGTKVDAGADGNPETTADNGTDLVTDADGCYLFVHLPPGTYYVKIPAASFAPGAPLEGMLSLSGTQTGDDDAGEDGIDDADPAANGIRSANVVLVNNGAPTGETGKDAANAVNLADDNNTDLTVDFGFTAPAGISGSIYADTNNDDAGDVLIHVVTLALYTDLNGDGDSDDAGEGPADDPNQPGTQDYVITTVDGTYHFTGLAAGSYVVRETQPYGFLTVTDLDSVADAAGSPADAANASTADNAIPVTLMPGETDAGNDFVEEKPSTFAAWQDAHDAEIGHTAAPGVNDGAAANPDGDAYTNLEEFAYCFPPASGVNGCVLELVTNTDGTVDACIRQVPGIEVVYSLEYISDLTASGADGAGWTEVTTITPVTSANGDGTVTVCYHDLESIGALSGGQGFVRAVVRADLNGDTDTADAGETARSTVSGWTDRTVAQACETFSMPYVKCPVITAAVTGYSAAGAGSLDLAGHLGGVALSAILDPAGCYYAEVLSGPAAGHRFAIDTAASTGTSLVVAAGSLTNTMTLPDLTGEQIAVREYDTISGLFPEGAYFAGTSAADSDYLLVQGDGQWDTYYLLDVLGTPRWVKVGAGLTDQGSACLNPGAGLYVHRRAGATDALLTGQVRQTGFALPLGTGYQLVPNPWPVDASPVDRAMGRTDGFTGGRATVTADQILLWNGDLIPSGAGYRTHFLLSTDVPPAGLNFWTEAGQVSVPDQNDTALFLTGRSQVMHLINAQPDYVMPLPWTP